MHRQKIGSGLCAVLVFGVAALTASAQQLNPPQIQLIEHTVASICNTVKEARGHTSEFQLQDEVKARVGGLIGKVEDVGGASKGSLTREEFEGLSRDATATALEGDRGCRERVFNRMFDKLSAEILPTIIGCIVTDPTGTPLNVRESPNGVIKSTLSNGHQVQLLRSAAAANGKPWVYVSDVAGREIGWVFRPYLTCSGPSLR
jgi:hypothetical protein